MAIPGWPSLLSLDVLHHHGLIWQFVSHLAMSLCPGLTHFLQGWHCGARAGLAGSSWAASCGTPGTRMQPSTSEVNISNGIFWHRFFSVFFSGVVLCLFFFDEQLFLEHLGILCLIWIVSMLYFFFFPPREHLENLMTKSQAYSRKLFEYILKQDTWINQGRRKHLMNYFTCLIYGWNTFIH